MGWGGDWPPDKTPIWQVVCALDFAWFARHGVPLEMRVTGASRHDVEEIIPLIGNLEPIGGKPGPPVAKPETVPADRADHRRSVEAISNEWNFLAASAIGWRILTA